MRQSRCSRRTGSGRVSGKMAAQASSPWRTARRSTSWLMPAVRGYTGTIRPVTSRRPSGSTTGETIFRWDPVPSARPQKI